MINDKHIADINDSRAVEDAVAGLSEDQLNFKENADRWSIMLVMEHILTTEMAIAQLILSLEGKDAEKTEYVGYQQVAKRVVNRKVLAKAPSFLIPTGKAKSLKKVLGNLKANREMLVTNITMPGFEFGGETRKHMLLGDLGATDWLSFLTGHTNRHILQIEEIKKHANFPA